MSGFVFDVAYTSYLKRAIRTLWHTLEQTELMYIPIINAWQLNERWALSTLRLLQILDTVSFTYLLCPYQDKNLLWDCHPSLET